jgi:hypothetical protein
MKQRITRNVVEDYGKGYINMKTSLILLMCLLPAVQCVYGQSTKGEHWDFLRKVKNSNIYYGISNPASIRDSLGNVIGAGNFVMLIDEKVSANVRKYGVKLIPELVDLLQNDTTRDWAANLMLYSITNKDAVVLKYDGEDLNKWRGRKKAREVKRWTEYLKEQSIQ